HYEREPLKLDGGNTFTFVTDGIESALEQARRAAKGKDVSLAGGARTAQQYLAAGLVDEMDISLAPVLLGNGERLFSGSGSFDKFEHVRTVCAPNVTHYKFLRR
ncbi:MAG: dihydrofolate reductase family protein, partial [Gemmatimonadaceae bacterium]